MYCIYRCILYIHSHKILWCARVSLEFLKAFETYPHWRRNLMFSIIFLKYVLTYFECKQKQCKQKFGFYLRAERAPQLYDYFMRICYTYLYVPRSHECHQTTIKLFARISSHLLARIKSPIVGKYWPMSIWDFRIWIRDKHFTQPTITCWSLFFLGPLFDSSFRVFQA